MNNLSVMVPEEVFYFLNEQSHKWGNRSLLLRSIVRSGLNAFDKYLHTPEKNEFAPRIISVNFSDDIHRDIERYSYLFPSKAEMVRFFALLYMLEKEMEEKKYEYAKR